MTNPDEEKETKKDQVLIGDVMDKESSLPKPIQEIIELVPPEKRERVEKSLLNLFIARSESFIGPMPPPHYLKQYNEIVPGGAERILKMTEKQSNHRIGLEDYSIHEEHRQSSKGQNLGFIIAVFALCISATLAWHGDEAVAGIIGGTTIVGLAGVFVYGQRQIKESLSEKDP